MELLFFHLILVFLFNRSNKVCSNLITFIIEFYVIQTLLLLLLMKIGFSISFYFDLDYEFDFNPDLDLILDII